MRKFLLANVLALAALAVLPDTSHAWGRDNYSAHGFGWLGSLAFRHKQWIHQDGPLYNYGPYNGGQGYVDMHIPRPWHGMYTPADPTLWNRGSAIPGAGNAPAAPQSAPPPTNHSAAPTIQRPAVLPAGFTTSPPQTMPAFPWWQTGR